MDGIRELTFYEFKDGHASAAENHCWIGCLFDSLDSAISWRDHWDEAEKEFKRINVKTGGKAGLYLPARKAENA